MCDPYQWWCDVLLSASSGVSLRFPDISGERIFLNSEVEGWATRRGAKTHVGIS